MVREFGVTSPIKEGYTEGNYTVLDQRAAEISKREVLCEAVGRAVRAGIKRMLVFY